MQEMVYVFGGCTFYTGTGKSLNRPNKSCERFELQNNRWFRLPDMQYARYAFNPCVFRGLIYLSGACDARVMEVFSPHQYTLPVTLLLPEKSSTCCVYVDQDLLVLHSEKYIVKFEAGPNGQLRQVSQQQVPKGLKWQNSQQPVVDRTRGVFFIAIKSKCIKVSMETGEKVRKIY